jgi:sporulation protein YlmC with PRC-barrel domain
MDSAGGCTVTRLSDLLNTSVRLLDGEIVGRVHEVHCDGGRVTAFMCGPGSFIERLTAKRHGRRVSWDRVIRLERKQIVVSDEKSSAARSRQGTRRASAQRSKR